MNIIMDIVWIYIYIGIWTAVCSFNPRGQRIYYLLINIVVFVW